MILRIDNITDIYGTWGILLSQSIGELSMPRRKPVVSHKWSDQHGVDEDLDNYYFEPREIRLDLICQATSQSDFYSKIMAFQNYCFSAGLHLLKYPVIARPFFVKFESDSAVEKLTKWDSNLLAGKLAIKAIEILPVGRYFYSPGNPTLVSFTISCSSQITIAWGDGTYTNVLGNNQDVSHTYVGGKVVYVGVLGNTNQITYLGNLNGIAEV